MTRPVTKDEYLDIVRNFPKKEAVVNRCFNYTSHCTFLTYVNDNDEPCGYIALESAVPPSSYTIGVHIPECIIHFIFVHPWRRGKGYGKELIKAAREFAVESGCGSIRCGTVPDGELSGFLEHIGGKPDRIIYEIGVNT